METKSNNSTDKAAEAMIAADNIWLMEEFAMCHLDDFAVRLEKKYGRKLKKAGIEQVDYFTIARRFTQSLLDRFASRDKALTQQSYGDHTAIAQTGRNRR